MGDTMAAQSDSSTRRLGDDSSGSRLVPASASDPGAGKGANNEPFAPDRPSGSLVEQFLQNLVRALSAWSDV